MKILFLSSEATGLLKTGGLADVARALPLALRQKGHDVRLVLPNYLSIARSKNYSTVVSSLGVPMGDTELFCAVQQTELERLPVYLIEYNDFFLRSHPYEDVAGNPHPDNGERFGFFCKAALQLCLAENFIPDIIHVNDWQGALACLYLRNYRTTYPEFAKTRSLLTIHNGGYQGHCSASAKTFLEIGDDWFHPAGFEDHGQINLLKGGLRAADQLNAVSVGYAEELKTPLGGHGLYGILQMIPI
jgi:starch synthase